MRPSDAELKGAPLAMVGEREYRALAMLLGNSMYRVTGQHAESAAENIVAKQSNIHTSFFQKLFKYCWVYVDDFTGNKSKELQQKIINTVFNKHNYSVKVSVDEVLIHSNTNAPIITEEDIDRFFETLGEIRREPDFQYASDVFGMSVAFYLTQCQQAGGWTVSALGSGEIEHNILRMSARIEAIRTVLNRPETLYEGTGSITVEISELGIAIAKASNDLVDLEKQSSSIRDEQESVFASLKNLTTEVESLSSAQTSALLEIKENLKLDEARKLWGSFGASAAKSFWVSAIVIAAVLIGFPVTAYFYKLEIIGFLTSLEISLANGSSGNSAIASTFTALGRLLIITAPLGFIVWLVRLLVRFNMRSMLLMDDARARVTMLDTYLFLIAQDAAVKQDRGAILEALFRRAPGHGSDTAEPPHFTDLLRYGQETPGQK